MSALGRADGIHFVHLNRVLDVLELLKSEVTDRQVEPVTHLRIDRFGDGDAARHGESLEPGCETHSLSVHVVVLDDDVTEMNADAHLHLLIAELRGVEPSLLFLDEARALDCLHDTVELAENGVSCRVDDDLLQP
ncbi:MAG: hypothetical protein P8R42_15835 [Candidatus Binatia bacterium]|nr:hypothetical protein [Candidatus Binatia bacterium]